MAYLQKLTLIITLLHISLLQLMHFNDLHFLFKCFTLLFDTGIICLLRHEIFSRSDCFNLLVHREFLIDFNEINSDH